MTGEGVRLAPLGERDREPMFEWINDRELVTWNAPFRPVTREDHDRWFDRIREARDVEIFAIRLEPDDRLIGSCQLNAIDRDGGTAHLQIRIAAPGDRGSGHGSEAIRLLVAHGFERLGLDRIELDVFADNERAVRAYERAGFRRVGLRPRGVVIEGEARDVIEMALDREAGA